MLVDANFGPAFSYFRQPAGSIPNGVISRFPILASGVWDDPLTTDRELVWTRLDVPGPHLTVGSQCAPADNEFDQA